MIVIKRIATIFTAFLVGVVIVLQGYYIASLKVHVNNLEDTLLEVYAHLLVEISENSADALAIKSVDTSTDITMGDEQGAIFIDEADNQLLKIYIDGQWRVIPVEP